MKHDDVAKTLIQKYDSQNICFTSKYQTEINDFHVVNSTILVYS